MSSSTYGKPLYIDNGTSGIKGGFSGDANAFRTIIDNIAGQATVASDSLVGGDPQSKRDLASMRYPIEHGMVTNWDDMETLWDCCFNDELKINPKDCPILLTEARCNTSENREKMIEIMFETYNFQATYVTTQAMLALCACDLTTGIVLDSGYGVTDIVPIYEGCVVPDACQGFCLAGCDLTDYLKDCLVEKGTVTIDAELEYIKEIKETLCYTASDYEHEIQIAESSSSSVETTYELPDGTVITVCEERLNVAECMFKSSLTKKDCGGIHDVINTCITKCDADIQKEMYANIVLSGGSTMFPCFAERMELEICKLATSSVDVKIIAPPERKCCVCTGGDKLTSRDGFEELWISESEYSEYGKSIVHTKC